MVARSCRSSPSPIVIALVMMRDAGGMMMGPGRVSVMMRRCAGRKGKVGYRGGGEGG